MIHHYLPRIEVISMFASISNMFQMATEREVLEEQIKTIKFVDVPIYYFGIHMIKTISFDAELPKDKLRAIEKINQVLKNTSEEVLNSAPKRHSI